MQSLERAWAILSWHHCNASAIEPMFREPGFLPTIVSLWFRLTTLGIVGFVFAESLVLAPGKVQGWTVYLTIPEVFFEVAVRLIFAALVGLAFGTLCAAALAPFLRHLHSSRERVVEQATRFGVLLVVFLDSRLALITLIAWSNRGVRFTSALLLVHFLVFTIVLCIPRARKEVVTSFDFFLRPKMTRRAVLATVGGATALAATEFAFRKTTRTVTAALAPQRPKSNFVLVTFDALSAEDMSLYGYRLPTTPNIDAFARKGTVFTNFYSASSFTTPSVATILTGAYPSESHVFQLQGRLDEGAHGGLPRAMRKAGYTTAAFLSNPFAYYLAKGLENDYDVLPEPDFKRGGLQNLWNATKPLHQNSGIGSGMEEYHDLAWVWHLVSRTPADETMRFRAAATFERARRVLAQLPDGFFLWIHVMPPHQPYIPDREDGGRFLPFDEQRRYEEEDTSRWKPHYAPDQQGQVNRRRLLYDEFISTADRAFGSFMLDLENGGRQQDTTVILSADHGESFEGGVFQHESPYLTRPVIHIPLIIRTRGQEDGRRVAFTADQTALAPTILELAGQKKPDWMRGQSLVEWLNRDGQGQGEGRAFAQFFEKNSVFRPLRHGNVGVIDGRSRYQYVLDLDTQKGSLRPLDQAQIWNLDRTADNPALADALRTAICSRFPEVVQKTT